MLRSTAIFKYINNDISLNDLYRGFLVCLLIWAPKPSGFDTYEILFSLWAGIFIANLVGFDDQYQDNNCDHCESSSVETPAELVEASGNESISQGDESGMTIKQVHVRRDEENLAEVLVEKEEESCNLDLSDVEVDEFSLSNADDPPGFRELVSTPLTDEKAHGTLKKTHGPAASETLEAKEEDNVLPVPPQIQSDATLVEGENVTKNATVNIIAYGEFQSTSGDTVVEIKIEVCETNEDADSVENEQTAPPDVELAEANPVVEQISQGTQLMEEEEASEGDNTSVYSSANDDSAVSELEYSADESTDPAGDLQLATPTYSLAALEQTSAETSLMGKENISEQEDPSLYSALNDDAVSEVDFETSEEDTLADTVRIPWAEMDESERAEEWHHALWTLRNNPPIVARADLKASESLSEATKLLNIPKIFAAGSSTNAPPNPRSILTVIKEMDENEQSESCAPTHSRKEDSPHASVIMDDIPAPQDIPNDTAERERDTQSEKWKRDVWALLNFPSLKDLSMTDSQDSSNDSGVETSAAVVGPVNQLPSSPSLRQSSESVIDKAEIIPASICEESEEEQTKQSDQDNWKLSVLALANFALPSPIEEREVSAERNDPVEKILQEVPVAPTTQSIEYDLGGSSANMALLAAGLPSVEEGSDKVAEEAIENAPTEFITVTIAPINDCGAICADKTPVFIALGGYRRQRKRAKRNKKQKGGMVMPAASSSESEDSSKTQASDKAEPAAAKGPRRHRSRQNRAQRQRLQELETRN